eukprot:TRINITY_DN49437_c0_g1_i1.p1 TRINITY_DN49437_c0_g1~~TRINITY_DN49437_c0_g1_i1.p1  ORF type:complete len:167 (-),score=7.71 TRINITY_DN49437_c0_g1_i1:45-545(-)
MSLLSRLGFRASLTSVSRTVEQMRSTCLPSTQNSPSLVSGGTNQFLCPPPRLVQFRDACCPFQMNKATVTTTGGFIRRGVFAASRPMLQTKVRYHMHFLFWRRRQRYKKRMQKVRELVGQQKRVLSLEEMRGMYFRRVPRQDLQFVHDLIKEGKIKAVMSLPKSMK